MNEKKKKEYLERIQPYTARMCKIYDTEIPVNVIVDFEKKTVVHVYSESVTNSVEKLKKIIDEIKKDYENF